MAVMRYKDYRLILEDGESAAEMVKRIENSILSHNRYGILKVLEPSWGYTEENHVCFQICGVKQNKNEILLDILFNNTVYGLLAFILIAKDISKIEIIADQDRVSLYKNKRPEYEFVIFFQIGDYYSWLAKD